MVGIFFLSLPTNSRTGRDVHAIRSYQIHVRNLGAHLDRLKSRFPARLSVKREQVLMLRAFSQVLEIWRERDGAVVRQIVRLAASGIGNLREKSLSRIDSPQGVAQMTISARVDRIHHNALALCLLNS